MDVLTNKPRAEIGGPAGATASGHNVVASKTVGNEEFLTSALILGILAGLFCGYISFSVHGSATLGGAFGVAVSFYFQAVSAAATTACVLGGALAKAKPVTGGLLMLFGVLGMLFLIPHSFWMAIPIILGGTGGVLAFLGADEAEVSTLKASSDRIAFAALICILLIAPMDVYSVFLMKALCFALFACAFNLLIGYVGLLSFGHALYFGWAGYVSAYAAKSFGLTPEAAIVLGTVVAAGLGLAVGALAIRRQGIYFAMITLALAQMMYFFALQAPFTGGEDGIQAVPRGKLFGLFNLADQTAMYVFVTILFVGCLVFIYRVIHSPFGEVLKAIRENEPRAISLGYKTDRYKLLVFILSATLAGVAGGTKAIVFQLASLTDVHWSMSGEVVLMTLVGGLGTVFGPVLGAFIIVAMENYLAQFGQWVTVIQGLVFVVCVLLFRRGIIGELAYALKVRL